MLPSKVQRLPKGLKKTCMNRIEIVLYIHVDVSYAARAHILEFFLLVKSNKLLFQNLS